MDGKTLFAAVMIKGTVKINRKVLDTLRSLGLVTSNMCVIIPADSVHAGMLKRVAEYVTWGEASPETLERMFVRKAGMDAKKAKSAASAAFKDGKLEANAFRLSPPSGGFRAVRLHYPRGDVGYRGEGINGLIARMI